MTKNRLEAFSDGVFAIILTIMVLELKVPNPADPQAYQHLGIQHLSYVLSFTYVAIYWVNHHHLLHTAKKVTGAVLWLNTLLLFFLSLFPFCTAWVGETHVASLPVLFYGVVLCAAGTAYYFLVHCLIDLHGHESLLARAVGKDFKGVISLVIYLAGVALATWWPYLSWSLYAFTALIWIIPDPRIERLLREEEGRAARGKH
jgi:uncharacterized membrane protein